MSHGNEKGEVIFSNGDRIVAQFSSKYCEKLNKKPKIFIFQACRGKAGRVIHREYDGDTFDKKLVAYMNNKQVSNFW